MNTRIGVSAVLAALLSVMGCSTDDADSEDCVGQEECLCYVDWTCDPGYICENDVCQEDTTAALERTFDFAGRAIVMTTIILAAGFLPFLLTDYYSTRMLGSLLPLCLVVALVAGLLARLFRVQG